MTLMGGLITSSPNSSSASAPCTVRGHRRTQAIRGWPAIARPSAYGPEQCRPRKLTNKSPDIIGVRGLFNDKCSTLRVSWLTALGSQGVAVGGTMGHIVSTSG